MDRLEIGQPNEGPGVLVLAGTPIGDPADAGCAHPGVEERDSAIDEIATPMAARTNRPFTAPSQAST